MVDVLVVGAGPTGLFMAAEAARHGLSVRIIDQAISRSVYSKAIAIQPRTLEIFRHLGIVDRFLDQGVRVRALNGLTRISFDELDTDYPFVLSLEQSKTEAILEEYLGSLGVRVERGVQLKTLEQFPAKWVVGCDGSHSAVRKLLGLSFEGRAFPSTFSLADVTLRWGRPHDEAYGFFTPKGLVGVLPLPAPDTYRLVFQMEGMTLGEIQELLPDAEISNPTWQATFQIHTRMVSAYRKGSVFLAGDAAHIHSPAGGQGMNSGIQDAFNLAWKLKSPHLLDTYNLERHSFGKRLLRYTERATRLMALRNPVARSVRDAALRSILRCPWFRRKLTRGVAQLSIVYPKSAIAVELGRFKGGPVAGSRAPTLGQKTKGHQILLFTDTPSQKFPVEPTLLIDRSKNPELCTTYGLEQEAIYIIRPDLVVGLRSSPVDWKKVADYLELV